MDAGLYLGQPGDLTMSWWNPAIYLDPVYWAELRRRNVLKGNTVDLDSYRREQPVQLPKPQLLPSMECVTPRTRVGHGKARRRPARRRRLGNRMPSRAISLHRPQPPHLRADVEAPACAR
jgi:hypothetical protein